MLVDYTGYAYMHTKSTPYISHVDTIYKVAATQGGLMVWTLHRVGLCDGNYIGWIDVMDDTQDGLM